MKIALFSDLHTEFDGKRPWSPEPLDADVIVFAGDNVTSPALLREYAQRVEQQQTSALRILYVCGNHEFYGSSIRFGSRGYDKYRQALADCPRSTLLETDVVEILGVRFIGATMWTAVKDSAKLDYNDYRYIRIDRPPYRRLRPSDARDRHFETVRFFEHAAATSVPTVVVTHHPPSSIGLDVEPGDPWAANLDELIGRWRPLMWLHWRCALTASLWNMCAQTILPSCFRPARGTPRASVHTGSGS
jgi:predicted MPP superfamily phosphohydrolase